MDNEELKKKILSIVRGAMLEADELPFVETAEYVADALIAAGIGDVKEAEHRAEVAERAFKELCIDKIFGQDDEPSIKWTWDFYKARAEKELAEERK